MAEKAKIVVLDDKGTTTKEIQVMFNPTEYTVSRTVQKTGQGANTQFNAVEMPEFKVSLFFDTYEKTGVARDVRKKTDEVSSLVMPTVSGKTTKRPPVCLFIWGGFSYKGIVSKIDQKFTMFLDTGIPVRAELTVTFSSILTKEEESELKPKEACRKLWEVRSGDRLDLIAYKTLKDAAQWRKIADANNIENPLTYPGTEDIGTTIVIPD